MRHIFSALILAATLQSPPPAPPANTVTADATSVAAGKKLYGANCASCHGETGQGDGRAGKTLTPPPANLADETWLHGSTDGEIFVVIRDGVKQTGMKAFGSRMTTHQMWDVVNYLRSIGPASPR